jgi:hypothetical protein
MPITVLMALLFIVKPNFRKKVTPWFAGLCGILLITTVLATQSGEALDEAFKGLAPTKEHRELGEMTRNIVGVLFLASIALFALGRRAPTPDEGTTSKNATLSLVSVVVFTLAVVGCVWMFRTGHEGAKIVWGDTFKKK